MGKNIKNFDKFKMNEENLPMKEWLPSDFDFRDYVDKNLPGLARRVLVPRDLDHIAHIMEMLAKAYSGEKSNDEFVDYLLSEQYDKALMEADDVNRIAFWTYVVFQINKVPIVLREKYKGQ
jgi:hypothetical protein